MRILSDRDSEFGCTRGHDSDVSDVDERELDRFVQRVSDLRCFAGTKLWRKRKLYGLGSEARSLDEEPH